MDINIDIDKNGLSDKIGGKLEQISTSKLDDVSIASLGLSLTESIDLNNLSSINTQLNNASTSLYDLENKVFDLAYEEIETCLSNSEVIGTIQTGVEIANKTISFAKQGLKIANSGVTIAANISKMATNLCGIHDPDITVTPSVKDSTSIVGASLKAILEAKFNEAKEQIIELYNSMICTSSASTIDNAVSSINGILDQAEKWIDPYMQQYTGHTISEVRYICNTGFNLVNMLKRASQQAKIKKDAAKQQADTEASAVKDAALNTAQETGNTVKNTATNIGNQTADTAKQTGASIASDASKAGNAITNQAKDFAGELAKEYSKDKIKAELTEWLDKQSFGLRNAFQLLMIKDMIEDIKESCQQLTNSSIENLADFVNATQVVFQIFDLIGYEYGKKGITISDITNLADAIKNTALATGQNITNQVQAVSAQMREYGSSVANTATSEANAIANKAQSTATQVADKSKEAANSVVNNATTAAENAKNSTINEATNAAQNAQSNISETTKNITSDKLNDLTNSTNTYNGQTITAESSTSDKTTTINVTLYVAPGSSDDVKNFIENYKDSKNNRLFNSGTRKRLREAFEDAWDDNETVTEEVSAKIDGMTHKYIFTITPDKKQYESYLAEQSKSTIDTGQVASLVSSKTSAISNTASNLASNTTTNQVSSLVSDSTSSAINAGTELTSNATDTASNIAKNTTNQTSQILDSVSINIDMSYITAVFANKVLIFQPIVDILDALNPLIKALQMLCHLIENYQINTEFVKEKKHASLAKALQTAAKLYNGLKDVFNLEDTNFFTIRTPELATWAIKNLKAVPDNNGFSKVNIDNTIKLYGYCTLHNIVPESTLSLLKGTTLYFDGTGIKEGDKLDGTTNGLDKIQINKDLGEIYFDASNRSIFSSEIMYANGENKDPYYVKDVSNQIVSDDDKFSNLFKSITIESDEAEGTQALSLDDTICCPKVELLSNDSDDNKIKDVVVVEFGKEYTMGEAVDYTINVSPGQSINKDTILAYIHKDNKNVPVKSIYGAGTILGINNDSDYLHIYPQNANRHIVIADTSMAEPDFNIEDISTLQSKMGESGELYQMIISLLLPSMYPIMLQHANRPDTAMSASKVGDKFGEVIENYNKEIADRSSDLKDLASEDSINKCATNPDKLVEIKDAMLAIRNVSMYKDVLYYYKGTPTKLRTSIYSTKTPLSTCIVDGAYDYSDCLGLAYDTPEYKDADITKESYGKDITSDLNRNYYVTLLSKITTRTGNKFAQEYYKLISNIIDNRLTQESIDVNQIIAQFNQLYKKTINQTTVNGFKYVSDSGFANIKVTDKDKINDLITFLKKEYLKYVICNSNQIIIDIPKSSSTLINSILSIRNAKEVQDASLDEIYDNVEQTLEDSNTIDYGSYSQRMNILTAQLANIFIYACVAQANNKSTKSGPDVKRIESYKDSLTTRLSTYKYAAEKWIKNNNGKTSNITNNYNKKIYSTFIEWLSAIYNEAKRRHDLDATSDLYVANIDKEVKKHIKNSIFNGSTPEKFDKMYDKVFIPYLNQNSSSKIQENSNVEVNRLINEYYYELTCKEAKDILKFWKKMLTYYGDTNNNGDLVYGEYSYKNIEKEIQDYADKLNSAITWPEPVKIDAGKYKCDLYTFINRNFDKAEMPEVDLSSTNNNYKDSSIPAITIDYNLSADLNQPKEGDITIMDYKYWLVYMLNATLFTLIPTYWSDGFDVPPVMSPLLLPAIYVPIAPPVKIPFVNVLIVFGIALRGIWPMPIVLMVNMNNHDLNAMLPAQLAIEFTKLAFGKIMETAENIVPKTINGLIDKASEENADFKKTLDKFRAYAAVIRSMPIQNKALIEQEFKDSINEQQQTWANEREKRKAERAQKKIDKRQVITREEDLGEGEDPM